MCWVKQLRPVFSILCGVGPPELVVKLDFQRGQAVVECTGKFPPELMPMTCKLKSNFNSTIPSILP